MKFSRLALNIDKGSGYTPHGVAFQEHGLSPGLICLPVSLRLFFVPDQDGRD